MWRPRTPTMQHISNWYYKAQLKSLTQGLIIIGNKIKGHMRNKIYEGRLTTLLLISDEKGDYSYTMWVIIETICMHFGRKVQDIPPVIYS